MKAYFILKDFVEDSWNAQSAGFSLKSYKIGGVETLTSDFFTDNQVVSANPQLDYYYYNTYPDGSNPEPQLDINGVPNFNLFYKHLKTNFNFDNGIPIGFPIGTQNGKNYGLGVLNMGVDKYAIVDGFSSYENGCFFVDVDFTKSLYIEFDILINNVNGQVYSDPQLFRKYKIIWNKKTCTHTFSYFSYETGLTYEEDLRGFLAGAFQRSQQIFIDFSGIECGGEEVTGCDNKERTRSFALFVDIPKNQDPVDTIKECCYNAEVLAQVEGNDYEKNDYTGIFHKMQVPNETADFVLVNVGTSDEYELNDNNLGVLKDFGTIAENQTLKTFVLEWKKVLLAHGEGTYTIIKRVNIAGIEYEESNINYTLRAYSVSRADKTVRLDIATSGYMERLKTDFANSDFKTSLRFGGFFGRREPKYEEDNIIYSNFESSQISMMQTNEYTLQSNLLPSCITQPILDFMLFANDIYINDYNLNNHLRDFIKFPVKFSDNKGTSYFSSTTKANLNLTFSDKKVDNIKRNYQ